MREVEEFPLPAPLTPHCHYVHNVYLYPMALAAMSHRNVAVTVQLRLDDELTHGDRTQPLSPSPHLPH